MFLVSSIISLLDFANIRVENGLFQAGEKNLFGLKN